MVKLFSKASQLFKRFKAVSKVKFGLGVTDLMGKKPDVFPTPPVAMADLLKLNSSLDGAILPAATGNRQSKEELKNIALVWNEAFGKTADYVTLVANGDKAIIEGAGFDPTKGSRTKKMRPVAVEGLTVTPNGFKHALVTGTKKKVAGASCYGYMALPANATVESDGNMMIVTVGDVCLYFMVATQKQVEMYNLPAEQPYTVSMFSVNTAGTGPFVTSQPVRPQ